MMIKEKRVEEDLKHVCRLCNKRYPSGKSLGGHMRAHVIANSNASSSSEAAVHKLMKPKKAPTRVCKQCGKAFQSLKALCGHMSTHSQKYRAVAVIGCSSNSSGVEIEHEQQQLAMCLMMLSRDSGFNFIDARSSANFAGKRKNLKFSSDNNKNYANGSVNMNLEISDSGYFENGVKDIESDDGYSRNYGIKKPKVEYGDDEEENHAQLKNNMKSRVKIKNGDFALKRIKSVNDNADKDAWIGSKKTKGHHCPFCPKVFRSGQALGGHKRSHLIGCSNQDKASMLKSVEENRRGHYHRLLDLNLPAQDDNGEINYYKLLIHKHLELIRKDLAALELSVDVAQDRALWRERIRVTEA